jgi:hypothetical protein
VENEDRFYILAEDQRNIHWLQNIMHTFTISFTVCNKAFGVIASIIHSQKQPKRITSLIPDPTHTKYKWIESGDCRAYIRI